MVFAEFDISQWARKELGHVCRRPDAFAGGLLGGNEMTPDIAVVNMRETEDGLTDELDPHTNGIRLVSISCLVVASF